MTPGFAKPRSKLPWLPYESEDKVIINSHNFTPAALDFSVNGNIPDSVWCPSLDDAGNETTTLTDLVGANDGTLANFALTGSTSNWVADTGAGGVRALDYDGVNDLVDITRVDLTADFSVSLWFKTAAFSASRVLFGDATNALPFFGSLSSATMLTIRTNSSGVIGWTVAAMATNVWHHVLVSRSSGNMRVWVDGAESSSGSQATTGTFSFSRIGSYQTPSFGWLGRLDDFRLWTGLSLGLSDAAFLYESGNGRGVQA